MIILSIVGARPQFIKAAAISRAIAEHNKKPFGCAIVEKIVHTGQHYDLNMSQAFFNELDIPRPDYNLGVGSGSHGEQTGRMLERIEQVLIKEKPDFVLVYGDTNSTVAGALAAAKLHIFVEHVEAGLRSFNRRMPEEINRVLTDHISDLLFCPTETAVKNLAREGISEGVYQVGDVMFDCTVFYTKRAKAIEQKTLQKLNIQSKSYYLATVHRAYNTDNHNKLRSIFDGLESISTPECPTLLPLHPRTKNKIIELGLTPSRDVQIIDPVSYLEMLVLTSNAYLILTDSGGLQKETYWLRVPCITLREETEWVETVESGWNSLSGVTCEGIVKAVRNIDSGLLRSWHAFYGDGHAAEKICKILLSTNKKVKFE